MPKIVASKEDWLKLGYEHFSESGVLGLNVDKMSRALKCNKSSFYWHFKSKINFINCLLDYWIEMNTIDIIAEVQKELSAESKFLKLIELAFKKDSNLDFIFYLKKHSQSDKKIKKIVDRIDEERIEFLNALLMGMGHSEKMAKVKAQVFYKYLIGYHEMIRYKKQSVDYLSEVLLEINQFIKINTANE